MGTAEDRSPARKLLKLVSPSLVSGHLTPAVVVVHRYPGNHRSPECSILVTTRCSGALSGGGALLRGHGCGASVRTTSPTRNRGTDYRRVLALPAFKRRRSLSNSEKNGANSSSGQTLARPFFSEVFSLPSEGQITEKTQAESSNREN